MSTYRNILMPRALDYYGEDQQKPVDAVPTPLEAWNSHCRDAGGGVGLAHGWHVIIAGATGHGKTLMALNLAATALKNGHSVCYVSLEMSQEQLQTRVYSIISGVPVSSLERGAFDPLQWQKAKGKLVGFQNNGLPVLLTNTGPVRNINDITEQMYGLLHDDLAPVRLFIIDYLQLANTGTDDEIYRTVSLISGQVMTFAHEHKVLTVGLSQLNRSVSANRHESPIAQGLIGSSSLENDADQVLILDHTRYQRDALNKNIARTWLILAKNRHGSSGSIPIEWDYSTLRCREGMQDEEIHWPGHKGDKHTTA